jgi:hypothetical protein
MVVTLGLARLPRTSSNLTGRRDDQQGREEKGQKGFIRLILTIRS